MNNIVADSIFVYVECGSLGVTVFHFKPPPQGTANTPELFITTTAN